MPELTGLAAPPALAEFLDAGCTLAEIPGFKVSLLVEAIAERADPLKWARWYREESDAWIAGYPSEMDLVSTVQRRHTQAEVCRYVWTAECLEDRALAERVKRLMGDGAGG